MNKDNIHLETNFEKYISRKLAELSTEENGWRISKSDKGFDPSTALYMPDFIEYLGATVPEKLELMKNKLGEQNRLVVKLCLYPCFRPFHSL